MANLWSIKAELKSDGVVRRVHYKMERVRECAYPSLDSIFLWCKDACETLLSELKEKEADQKDLEHVKKEIVFLKTCQADLKAKHKNRKFLIAK